MMLVENTKKIAYNENEIDHKNRLKLAPDQTELAIEEINVQQSCTTCL